MKKVTIILLAVLFLSGCTTYKFHQSAPSGSQGYLVSYNDETILEYTIGGEKSLPDLALAQERFKRRRIKVEYYYKKMGLIEGRFREVFWAPSAMFMDFLSGILRWPFIAVADYKYNRNLKYKERVDRLDEEQEVIEKTRINKLKEKLDIYIAQDLAKEPLGQNVVGVVPVAGEPQPKIIPAAQQPLEQAPAVEPVSVPPVEPILAVPAVPVPVIISPVVEVPQIKIVWEPPIAVITAKPLKGYSPLKVSFSGQRSSSKNGKIVAYSWDFGDGDTSTKKNPENTYWSTTFGTRSFIATLTVKDAAGAVSSATSIIEVSTL